MFAADDADVKDLGGKTWVLDVMLYRRYPQHTPYKFEHLVIELKRPACKLGQKEIDLTVACDSTRVAIEAKFKVKSDGAYPDNRTAAFDDLALALNLVQRHKKWFRVSGF